MLSEGSCDYQASVPLGDISRSPPGHHPCFCACQCIVSLPTVMAPCPLTESSVDTEMMIPLAMDAGQGITAPEQGRKLSVMPQMRQRHSGLRKLGGKGKRKCLAETEALLPDGSTGFESGTKLQCYQRSILEKVPTPREPPPSASELVHKRYRRHCCLRWKEGGRRGSQSELETRSCPECHDSGNSP